MILWPDTVHLRCLGEDFRMMAENLKWHRARPDSTQTLLIPFRSSYILSEIVICCCDLSIRGGEPCGLGEQICSMILLKFWLCVSYNNTVLFSQDSVY